MMEEMRESLVVQGEAHTVAPPSTPQILKQLLHRGFAPGSSLALTSIRQPRRPQLLRASGTDVAVTSPQALKRLAMFQAISRGLHSAISLGFMPLFIAMLARDAHLYQHDADGRYGFAPHDLAFPIHASDTFYTGSFTTYFPSEQWQFALPLLLAPFAIGALNSALTSQQFEYDPANFKPEDGRANTFKDFLKRCIEHPHDPRYKYRVMQLLDTAGMALLHRSDLPDEERTRALERLTVLATGNPNGNTEYPKGDRSLSAYAQSWLHHIIEVKQGSQAVRKAIANNAEHPDAVLIQTTRETLRTCQQQGGAIGAVANYYQWLRGEHQHRALNLHIIHLGFLSLMHGIYWLLVTRGLAQAMQHAIERGLCHQQFAYVERVAAYVCAVCAEWQAEVNAADLDNAQACLSQYLAHPHTPQDIKDALTHIAKSADSGAAWSIDLSQQAWESLPPAAWQMISGGLQHLFQRVHAQGFNLSRVNDIHSVDLYQKLGDLLSFGGEVINLNGQPLDAALLQQLTFPPELAELYLDNTGLDDTAITALATGLHHTQLTTLSMAGANMATAGAVALATLIRQWPLAHYNLAGGSYTDEALSTLLQATNSSLTHLNLAQTSLGSHSLTSLSRVVQGPLQALNLAECDINPLDWPDFAVGLGNSTTLTHLNLAGAELTLYSLQAILSPTSALTHLVMDGCDLSGPLFTTFCKLLSKTAITHLSLKDCGLLADDIYTLCDYLPDCQLEYLELGANSLQDTDWRLLANATELAGNTTLHLGLAACDINDAECEALATGFSGMTRPYTLDISHNEMTDVASESLADLVADTPLRALNISDNAIGDATGFALAKVIAESELRDLNLANTQVSAHAAAQLTARLPHGDVRLNFAGTSVGDDVVEAFIDQLFNGELPHPDDALTGPSRDWRHFVPNLPVAHNAVLDMRDTDISPMGREALCYAEYAAHKQGHQLDLFLGDGHQPDHCGYTSSASQASTNLALLMVAGHLGKQVGGFMLDCVSQLWQTPASSAPTPTPTTSRQSFMP